MNACSMASLAYRRRRSPARVGVALAYHQVTVTPTAPA